MPGPGAVSAVTGRRWRRGKFIGEARGAGRNGKSGQSGMHLTMAGVRPSHESRPSRPRAPACCSEAGCPRARRAGPGPPEGQLPKFASGTVTRRGSVALTSSDAGDGDGRRPRGVGGGGQLATAACAVVHIRSRCRGNHPGNARLNNLMIVPCVDRPRMPRAHPCPWSFLKLWTVLRSAMCICCAGFFQSSHDEHNVSSALAALQN